MKEIVLDEKIEEHERIQAENEQAIREARKQAMEDFRKSPAYLIVLEILDEEEKNITEELGKMQTEDMKSVFMLPIKEQRARLASMSKRNAILTGVLAILKKTKQRI